MWAQARIAVMAENVRRKPYRISFSERRAIMAVTSFATGDNLAVKLWSKKIAVEALKQTWC